MHVCMLASVHVCMYACMHVCMYVCMYIMYACIYVCMHVCMYVRTYVYMYVRLSVCIYVSMYLCMCILDCVCKCAYYCYFHFRTLYIHRNLICDPTGPLKKYVWVAEPLQTTLGFHVQALPLSFGHSPHQLHSWGKLDGKRQQRSAEWSGYSSGFHLMHYPQRDDSWGATWLLERSQLQLDWTYI